MDKYHDVIPVRKEAATPDTNTVASAEDKGSGVKPSIPPLVTTDQPVQSSGKSKKLLIGAAIVLVVLIGGVGAYAYFHQDKSNQSTALLSKSASATKPVQLSSASEIASAIPEAISPVDSTKIPLGDNRVSTSARAGYVYSCQTNFSAANGGAQVVGPWVDTASSTWDGAKKVAVSGSVGWPAASYKVSVSGSQRTIAANDLPINGQTTGIFPIQAADKAYAYDRNPNTISAQTVALNLPVTPAAATTPGCVPGGMIGVLQDGVVLFDALDGEGRDAAAHETLDSCEGHPEKTGEYHHHNIPTCIMDKYKSPSSSTLVGYAADGYGIYIERDKNGNLLTNANLDACHGRTSKVMWDGKVVSIYHYDATIEFPYTVGCFHGTSTLKQAQQPQGSTQPSGGQSGPPQAGAGSPPPPQRL